MHEKTQPPDWVTEFFVLYVMATDAGGQGAECRRRAFVCETAVCQSAKL